MDLSKGNITLSETSVSGFDRDGNQGSEVNPDGYRIVQSNPDVSTGNGVTIGAGQVSVTLAGVNIAREMCIRDRDDNLRTPTFGFTPVFLFDGEKLEATAAYNTFQLYEDTTDENFYRSVYNQLMLGAHYNWNYEYTPVREDGRFCAATCKVLICLLYTSRRLRRRRRNGP